MISDWSFTYFLVQVLAGFLGAHGAALVAHEYRCGLLGHSLVGFVAGVLSGLFLQHPVMTIVTAAGDAMPITDVEALISQATIGLVCGGIAMLAVGFVRYEMAKASSTNFDH